MQGGDEVIRRIAPSTGQRARSGAALALRVVTRLSGPLLGAILALAAGLGSGAAYAYWTAGGSGFGTATTATPHAVTLVAASGTVSDKLSPGGTAELLIRLDNPNTHPVTITGISGSGEVLVPDRAACNTSGVSVPTRNDLSITVDTGFGVVVSIPHGSAMSLASDSGCQGATFQIPVTLTVRS
jgi:hypothetical protein